MFMKVIEIFAVPQNVSPKCNIDTIYISNKLLNIKAQVMVPVKKFWGESVTFKGQTSLLVTSGLTS